MPLYDEKKIQAAIEAFDEVGLNDAEAIMAAVRLVARSVDNFRAAVPELRTQHSPDELAAFARLEFNDLIAELQDAMPPAVRAFNAILRDPEAGESGIE